MVTNNIDINGLVRRARRFRFEIYKSQSANSSFINEPDVKRYLSYIAGYRAYLAFVQSQMPLDLPESSPRAIELGEAEKFSQAENESVVDLIALWDLLEAELVNSQSSRFSTKLIDPDFERASGILNRMELFINDYVMNIQPLDLPESSPLRMSTGVGRSGINPLVK